ncbi:MAG: tRNA (adenosine(37)-N6)-threonylcarbamoyltransferase complex ATPase subunit type 1 TsaE [Armatimonadota bacterium]|nr:tRNA (adenosine(37)-N6)-threonylcarbamoyltransferase complex ATPase subunit type 1 TsaE [Armatimonadota bacterium]MDR7422536.1 tRNA (adenosine(37)-N6)-threonylcarbamoyltransferase complex ATPase subunit type 1 TsaE [Armatimonadota bacterium]MDR7454205.1 tRNA (adenosine(37)-N6)-threonylcarbamoyltransferase complex ATPase subunit type 1 TsaE [Armatimonadota bacterium]MDR7458164.1 tRNA (adenosine(37)-N6)-threonylcarbamoyltransferase complex ATPase subunit type 1 TsaE [Armatimonadota bacterium]M
MRLATSSPSETEALGRRLGGRLRAGDVVALLGPLGAGKTVLARGIVEGAGARGTVASPSFVIVREYAGPVRVYHADLYRLERPAEVVELGLDELAAEGILVVEWADRAGGLLPRPAITVVCDFGEGETARTFTVEVPPALADRAADL